MNILVASLIINLALTVSILGADFNDLNWGMNQQEVINKLGQPYHETENKIIFGTLTQTLSYKDDDNTTYELLFLENLLTNASFTISTDQKIPANVVSEKYTEVIKSLDEIYEAPVSAEKIDNSTKKIIYEGNNTKVMIIYFNIPIKGEYVNRTAYLKVNYKNNDIVLKAKVNNRRVDRERSVKQR